MHRLDHLAARLGLGALWLKDESWRFGLNAFKGLGASYAVARLLAERFNCALNDRDALAAAARASAITLVTATDGNHGRGVAWTAEQLGLSAVVLMPHGADEARAAAIRAHGAQCTITPWNYDDAVREAARLADANGWLLVQDTAWPGYEDIPHWIMQGYATLVAEAMTQWPQPPTHVILQAGVGAFAGAVMATLDSALGENAPAYILVEPENAACFYQSVRNGTRTHVSGELHTLMAGLACGETSTLAWPYIGERACAFFAVDDSLASRGMCILAAPRPNRDPAIIAGESGAIGAGLLHELCTNVAHNALRHKLGLNGDARVLLVSTEGDTSPGVYEEVIWKGRQK